MRVWLKQHHNQLLDSYRYGEALIDKDRVVVLCPETENQLVNCSRKFFDSEVAKGRVILCKPEGTDRRNCIVVPKTLA